MKIKRFSKQLTYWTGVVVTGLIVGTALQIASAWVSPSVSAPDGNVGAPINTGDISQTKSGGLNVSGDVGIGNSAPAKKLDVTGDIHATGDICTDLEGGKCLSKGFGDSEKILSFPNFGCPYSEQVAPSDGFAVAELQNFLASGAFRHLFICVRKPSGGCEYSSRIAVEGNSNGNREGSLTVPVGKGKTWYVTAVDNNGLCCDNGCTVIAKWIPNN